VRVATSTCPPPVWSPPAEPVLFGAGWVLLGAVSYLITGWPLVLLGAFAASVLTGAVASARESSARAATARAATARAATARAATLDGDAAATSPEVVVDLEARLEHDAGRR
jgi:hypothetical protein